MSEFNSISILQWSTHSRSRIRSPRPLGLPLQTQQCTIPRLTKKLPIQIKFPHHLKLEISSGRLFFSGKSGDVPSCLFSTADLSCVTFAEAGFKGGKGICLWSLMCSSLLEDQNQYGWKTCNLRSWQDEHRRTLCLGYARSCGLASLLCSID